METDFPDVKYSNKAILRDLREVIRNALDRVGGEDYLLGLAKTHPALFVSLILKIIPQEMKLSGEVDHNYKLTDEQKAAALEELIILGVKLYDTKQIGTRN